MKGQQSLLKSTSVKQMEMFGSIRFSVYSINLVANSPKFTWSLNNPVIAVYLTIFYIYYKQKFAILMFKLLLWRILRRRENINNFKIHSWDEMVVRSAPSSISCTGLTSWTQNIVAMHLLSLHSPLNQSM